MAKRKKKNIEDLCEGEEEEGSKSNKREREKKRKQIMGGEREVGVDRVKKMHSHCIRHDT